MNQLRRYCARDNGFALLVSLWSVALFALLGNQLFEAGRGEALLARNLMAAASVQVATDSGIQIAIFHLLDRSDERWAADGLPHNIQVGRALVTIRIENEGNKINPNVAAEPLLTALLLRVGAEPSEAGAIAAAILDWRTASSQPRPRGAKAPQYAAAGLYYGPPGSEFRSVDELSAVLGMRPALLALLRPHLTVFSDSDPDGSTTDPVVLAALTDLEGVSRTSFGQPAAAMLGLSDIGARGSRTNLSNPVGLQVASIVARAQGSNQTSYAKRAVVRLNATGGQRPFELLAFERLGSELGSAH